MAEKFDPITAGRYYGELPNGRLVEVEAPGRAPDLVICRRVADFPGGRAPAGAAVAPCPRCGAAIAFNPAGRHLDRPRVCMQCQRIAPDPIEVPS